MTRKTALVTGASRGIGKAIAQRLAADGFFVFGTATTQSGVDLIETELGKFGSGLQLQLTDANSITNALQHIKDSNNTVSVLVNNAGVTKDNLMLRMSDSMWDDVVDTNLTGMFRITKPLLRGMLKSQWGRIVNIGSVVARLGNSGQVNYCATKAGIEGFTRALATEVASRRITVNCVAPGYISTDMTSELPESVVTDLMSRIPLGRIGTPEDIANTVAFLVSSEANYITGQTIHVNGGLFSS